MLKNNSGISMLTVILTIIVMIILISITINGSIKTVEETNLTKIANEIKNLKDAVNIRMTNYERNATTYPLIGEKVGDDVFKYILSIENMSNEEKLDIVDTISVSYNQDKQDYYRLIESADAERLGVEGLDEENYYIIDYYYGEVYGPVKL